MGRTLSIPPIAVDPHRGRFFNGLLGYAYRWDDWALSLGVTGALGTQHTSAESVTLRSIGGDALLERRWTVGALSLGLGAGAEASVIWQALDRTDAARVAAAGYPTAQHYRGIAPGPVAVARLRAAIGVSAWVDLAVRGGLLFPEMNGGLAELWTTSAGVGTGLQF